MADLNNRSDAQASGNQAISAASEPTELILGTVQVAEIALYMYHEWEKAMQPPLFTYKQFPEWLEQVITAAKNSPDDTTGAVQNATDTKEGE